MNGPSDPARADAMRRPGVAGRLRLAGWVLVVVATALSGCGPAALATGPAVVGGQEVVCMAALAEGILHGDPDDPRLAWLVNPDGVRYELQWPRGFTARFNPELEMVASNGEVVAREGDDLDLGGGFGARDGAFSVCEIDGTYYLPG
jgi:hypothetical protein